MAKNIPPMPGLGDRPEDFEFWWREWFPELLRQSLGEGFKKYFLGSEKDNLGAMLLRYGEIYGMPAQNVTPVYARPIKITTPPGDGMEIPPSGGVFSTSTFYTGVSFRCPDSNAAVIKCVHQELESPAAYNDVNVRLFYRGKGSQFWNPHKPEVTPVSIVIFQEDTIEIQWENNGIVPHWFKAEIIGYVFGVDKPTYSQRGLRTDTMQASH